MEESNQVLETEYKFYQEHRTQYQKEYDGKVLLIKGKKLLGIFDTLKQAYTKGLDLLGSVPMFIQEIPDEEAVKERLAKQFSFKVTSN